MNLQNIKSSNGFGADSKGNQPKPAGLSGQEFARIVDPGSGVLSGDGTTNPEQTTQGENVAAVEVEGAIHNNTGN